MPVFTLQGIEVDFPYEPYDCQKVYMEKVITALQEGENALLESPTGTGKTLCLLCAALAWRAQQKKKVSDTAKAMEAGRLKAAQAGEGGSYWADSMREAQAQLVAAQECRLPPIIYSSRTHSQLAQVMKELKRTSYRPRACVLGSRQQMCLHPSVNGLSGAAVNQGCRALVSKRACRWHNKVEEFVRRNPDANAEPLDIEELVALGQGAGPCPYYLARDMAATADIVFLPYNYLIDARSRMGMNNIAWKGAVLIFDEAHNVESVCADAASFDLPASTLAGCMAELQQCIDIAMQKRSSTSASAASGRQPQGGGGEAAGPNYAQMVQDLNMLKQLLGKLESAIARIALTAGDRAVTRSGEFLFDQLLRPLNINNASVSLLLNRLDAAMDLLSGEAIAAGRKAGTTSSSYKLNAFADALRLAFATDDLGNVENLPEPSSYRVHIHLEKSKGGMMAPTLSYWCFAPGLAMRQLRAMAVRSILLTSGTLSPLDSFAYELQLPFRITLENPHVVDDSQVWIGVVPVGPAGAALNSSFQTRDTRHYKEDLGCTIVNLARIVPDGLLVFFPSYTVLRSCIDAWKTSATAGGASIYDRITKLKQAVVEPKESALFQAACDDYRRKVEDPSCGGAIFFAVCRGKVSEGLDFSDRAGRAVVITGIPFAPVGDAKVQLKRQVLDAAAAKQRKAGGRGGAGGGARLTGEAWYTQQAARAVNQAMGRVIRHRADYGAIILADERFQGESQRRQVSLWLRQRLQLHPSFGAAASTLSRFFKDKVGMKAPTKPTAAHVMPRNAAFVGTSAVGKAAAASGSHMEQLMASMRVPAAVDLSGLAGITTSSSAWRAAATPAQAQPAGGSSRLLNALNQPLPTSSTSAKHAGSNAGSAHASLMDGVCDVLDGQAALLATGDQLTASSVPATRSAMSNRLPAARPAKRMRLLAGPAGAQAASNNIGPAHLIHQHQQRLRAAATDAPGPTSSGIQPAIEAPPTYEEQSRVETRAESAPGQDATAAGALCSTTGNGSRVGPAEGLQAGWHTHPKDPAQNDVAAAGGMKAGGSGTNGRNQQAKDYMTALRSDLPPDAYNRITKELLPAFRKERNQHELVSGVVEVLRQPGCQHLLQGFALFLRASEREWYNNVVGELLANGARPSPPLPAAAASHQHPSAPAHPARQPPPFATHRQVQAMAQRPPQQLQPVPAVQALSRRPALPQPGGPSRVQPCPAPAWPRPQASADNPTPAVQRGQSGLQINSSNIYRGGQQPLRAVGPGRLGAQQHSIKAGLPQGAAPGRPRMQQPHQPELVPARSQAPPAMRQQQQRLQPPAVTPAGLQQRRLPASHLPAAAPGKQQGCPVCAKCPMEQPWEASCSHKACYACWLKVLPAKFECPVCRRRTQKRNIRPAYFA